MAGRRTADPVEACRARQAQNIEAERKACEIRLRAERKAGELLGKMEKAKGGQPKNRSDDPTTTLRDLGVSKDQSSQWQRLAAVPRDDFEAALADRTAMPTTAGIIRAAAEPKVNPVSADAHTEIPLDGFLWWQDADFFPGASTRVRDGVHATHEAVHTTR